LREHIEFWRQFRARFQTTGAVAPSSRFLAAAMTGPLKQRAAPARILEVGPGTGAVTRRIVRLMRTDERLDLVELNERFASLLEQRFHDDPAWRRVNDQSNLHRCSLEEFETDTQYDFIISGLPLNNFPCDLVTTILDKSLDLLAPGGVFSYFEYMYVRPLRRLVSDPASKTRLQDVGRIVESYLSQYRVRRNWVFVNLPPAWVQHLRNDNDG
jgi:phospholipid N-methyltransferase